MLTKLMIVLSIMSVSFPVVAADTDKKTDSNSDQSLCYLKFVDTWSPVLVRVTTSKEQILYSGHTNDVALNILSAVNSGICTFKARQCKIVPLSNTMSGYSDIKMDFQHPRTQDGYTSIGLLLNNRTDETLKALKEAKVCL